MGKNKRISEINIILKNLGLEDELHKIDFSDDEMIEKFGSDYVANLKFPYCLGADIYTYQLERSALEEIMKIPEFSRIEIWETERIDEETGEVTDEMVSFMQLIFDGIEMV